MADSQTSLQKPPIGYRQPPAETRFRKGQSGNPTGKRRGTGNRPRPHAERLVSLMLEEAYRPIKVNDDGREVTMPVARAIFRSLAAAAAKGEMRAQAMFLKMVSTSEEEAAFYEQMLADADEANGSGRRDIEIRIVDPADVRKTHQP